MSEEKKWTPEECLQLTAPTEGARQATPCPTLSFSPRRRNCDVQPHRKLCKDGSFRSVHEEG
eukprot:131030-Rhodomonas_salina.3